MSFILLPGNESGVILHATKQNKQTNKKCLSFLSATAFSRNSVAILKCGEEGKQVYQIFGKQEPTRSKDQPAAAFCKRVQETAGVSEGDLRPLVHQGYRGKKA